MKIRKIDTHITKNRFIRGAPGPVTWVRSAVNTLSLPFESSEFCCRFYIMEVYASCSRRRIFLVRQIEVVLCTKGAMKCGFGYLLQPSHFIPHIMSRTVSLRANHRSCRPLAPIWAKCVPPFVSQRRATNTPSWDEDDSG